MIGRRLPAEGKTYTMPEQPGDYSGPVDAGNATVVYFLLPIARDEGVDPGARSIHCVTSPPHVFRECPDGSLEIRESIGARGAETAGCVSGFDRFASWCSRQVSRAPFFVACVLLVVLWAPSIFVLRDVDTWQLIINTVTTIVTFLLVSLMQNGQQQFENAVHVKLDSIAEALKGLQDTQDDVLDRAIGAERETGA